MKLLNIQRFIREYASQTDRLGGAFAVALKIAQNIDPPPPPPPPPPPEPEPQPVANNEPTIVHEIKHDDTTVEIGEGYGYTLESLELMNPDLNLDDNPNVSVNGNTLRIDDKKLFQDVKETVEPWDDFIEADDGVREFQGEFEDIKQQALDVHRQENPEHFDSNGFEETVEPSSRANPRGTQEHTGELKKQEVIQKADDGQLYLRNTYDKDGEEYTLEFQLTSDPSNGGSEAQQRLNEDWAALKQGDKPTQLEEDALAAYREAHPEHFKPEGYSETRSGGRGPEREWESGKLEDTEVVERDGQLYLINTYEDSKLEVQLTYAPGEAPEGQTAAQREAAQAWQDFTSDHDWGDSVEKRAVDAQREESPQLFDPEGYMEPARGPGGTESETGRLESQEVVEKDGDLYLVNTYANKDQPVEVRLTYPPDEAPGSRTGTQQQIDEDWARVQNDHYVADDGLVAAVDERDEAARALNEAIGDIREQEAEEIDEALPGLEQARDQAIEEHGEGTLVPEGGEPKRMDIDTDRHEDWQHIDGRWVHPEVATTYNALSATEHRLDQGESIEQRMLDTYREDPTTDKYFDKEGYSYTEGAGPGASRHSTGAVQSQEIVEKDGQLYLKTLYEDEENPVELQLTYAPDDTAPADRTETQQQFDREWVEWKRGAADSDTTDHLDGAQQSRDQARQTFETAVESHGEGSQEKVTGTLPEGVEPVLVSIDGDQRWVHPEVALAQQKLDLARTQRDIAEVQGSKAALGAERADYLAQRPSTQKLLDDGASKEHEQAVQEAWMLEDEYLEANSKNGELTQAREHLAARQQELNVTQQGLYEAAINLAEEENPELAKLDPTKIADKANGGEGDAADSWTQQEQRLLDTQVGQQWLSGHQQLAALRQAHEEAEASQEQRYRDARRNSFLLEQPLEMRRDPEQAGALDTRYYEQYDEVANEAIEARQQALPEQIAIDDGLDQHLVKALGLGADSAEVIAPVEDEIRNIGGEGASIEIIPILYRNGSEGVRTTALFRVTGQEGKPWLVDESGSKYRNLEDFRSNNYLSESGDVYVPEDIDHITDSDGNIAYEWKQAREISAVERVITPVMSVVTAAATVASFTPLAPIAAPVAFAGGAYFGAQSAVNLKNMHEHGRPLTSTQGAMEGAMIVTAALPMASSAFRFAGLTRAGMETTVAARTSLGAISRRTAVGNPMYGEATNLISQRGAAFTTARWLDASAMGIGVPQLGYSGYSMITNWEEMTAFEKSEALMNFATGVFGTGMGYKGLRDSWPGRGERNIPTTQIGETANTSQQGSGESHSSPNSLSAAYHPEGAPYPERSSPIPPAFRKPEPSPYPELMSSPSWRLPGEFTTALTRYPIPATRESMAIDSMAMEDLEVGLLESGVEPNTVLDVTGGLFDASHEPTFNTQSRRPSVVPPSLRQDTLPLNNSRRASSWELSEDLLSAPGRTPSLAERDAMTSIDSTALEASLINKGIDSETARAMAMQLDDPSLASAPLSMAHPLASDASGNLQPLEYFRYRNFIGAVHPENPNIMVRASFEEISGDIGQSPVTTPTITIDALQLGNMPPGSDSRMLTELLQHFSVYPTERLVFSNVMRHELTANTIQNRGDAADTAFARTGARALRLLGLEPAGYQFDIPTHLPITNIGIDIAPQVQSSRKLADSHQAVQPQHFSNPHPMLGMRVDPRFSSKLAEHVRSRDGVPFAEFMDHSLYGLNGEGGYYNSGTVTIGGHHDDFRTAPEQSRYFGRSVAQALAGMHESMGRPRRFDVVEMGAGNGTMARDIIEKLQADHPELYGALHYTIVERSHALIGRQKETLAGQPVHWLHASADAPPLRNIRGVFISNELPDAFPVHRAIVRDGEVKEIYVTADDKGRFIEAEREPGPALAAALPDFERLFPIVSQPDGQQLTINARSINWVRELGSALDEGYVITFDYGNPGVTKHGPYALYSRDRGSVDMAYEYPGTLDITSLVDPIILSKVGKQAGLEPVTTGLSPDGYYTQRDFLVEHGIKEALAAEADAGEQSRAARLLGEPYEGFFALVQEKKRQPSPARNLTPVHEQPGSEPRSLSANYHPEGAPYPKQSSSIPPAFRKPEQPQPPEPTSGSSGRLTEGFTTALTRYPTSNAREAMAAIDPVALRDSLTAKGMDQKTAQALATDLRRLSDETQAQSLGSWRLFPQEVAALTGDPQHLSKLTLNEFAEFTPEQLGRFTIEQMAVIPQKKLAVLSEEQLAAFTHEQVEVLSRSQRAKLTPDQVVALETYPSLGMADLKVPWQGTRTQRYLANSLLAGGGAAGVAFSPHPLANAIAYAMRGTSMSVRSFLPNATAVETPLGRILRGLEFMTLSVNTPSSVILTAQGESLEINALFAGGNGAYAIKNFMEAATGKEFWSRADDVALPMFGVASGFYTKTGMDALQAGDSAAVNDVAAGGLFLIGSASLWGQTKAWQQSIKPRILNMPLLRSLPLRNETQQKNAAGAQAPKWPRYVVLSTFGVGLGISAWQVLAKEQAKTIDDDDIPATPDEDRPQPNEPTPEPPPTQCVVLPADGLNLRARPSDEALIVVTFTHGTFLEETGSREIDADGNAWVPVRGMSPAGKEQAGWVMARYVDENASGAMIESGRVNPELEDKNYVSVDVYPNETLASIAVAHDHDIAEVASLNSHIIDPEILYPGDHVYLPKVAKALPREGQLLPE